MEPLNRASVSDTTEMARECQQLQLLLSAEQADPTRLAACHDGKAGRVMLSVRVVDGILDETCPEHDCVLGATRWSRHGNDDYCER